MMDEDCHKGCDFVQKIRHSPKTGFSKVASAPYYLFSSQGYHRLTNNVDLLLPVSPAVSRRYEEIGIEPDLLKLIPHCYDPSFVMDNERQRDSDTGLFRIIYVGRLSRFKGVRFLVEAVNELSPDDVIVDIIGDGPQREYLESLTESYSLTGRIRFHGRVPHWELPALYDAADIFVHPGTLPEPYGRTVIEAMQCGAIPVVSDTGGPPWIVGDAGRTFTPGDAEDLAACLEGLLNQAEREMLISRCEDRLEHFSPDRIGDLLEETYLTQFE